MPGWSSAQAAERVDRRVLRVQRLAVAAERPQHLAGPAVRRAWRSRTTPRSITPVSSRTTNGHRRGRRRSSSVATSVGGFVRVVGGRSRAASGRSSGRRTRSSGPCSRVAAAEPVVRPAHPRLRSAGRRSPGPTRGWLVTVRRAPRPRARAVSRVRPTRRPVTSPS